MKRIAIVIVPLIVLAGCQSRLLATRNKGRSVLLSYLDWVPALTYLEMRQYALAISER
jgi:hypothetical protein